MTRIYELSIQSISYITVIFNFSSNNCSKTEVRVKLYTIRIMKNNQNNQNNQG